MKKILLLSCICTVISVSVFSQKIYLADTAFTTDVGYGGAPACGTAPHMEYNGWNNDRSKYEWVADAFTVPTDSTWVFDTVIIYQYKYNTSPSYQFLNCNMQIFDGTPGLGGSVIWGDTSTNLISSTGFTGIYKVDTLTSVDGGLLGNKRPIMYLKLHLSPAPRLTAGTYWLSWAAAGPGTNNADVPDKVLPGRVNPSGQMARGEYNGTWQYLSDSGNTIGFDKILIGSAAAISVLGVPGTDKEGSVLNQNTPNPFSGSTDIAFYLQQAGYVHMGIYNTIGQLVATPIDGNTTAGQHRLTFKANDLPPGIYYYQLTTAIGVESKQMLLVR